MSIGIFPGFHYKYDHTASCSENIRRENDALVRFLEQKRRKEQDEYADEPSDFTD